MPSSSGTLTVKTRILLISDTHFRHPNSPDLSNSDYAFSHPLPAADILIHAGDLTMTGLYSEHKLAVDCLRSHPSELKLVIAGNHDVTLDATYYLKEKPHMAGGEYPEDTAAIKALYVSGETVADGVCYMEESTETFTLANGARFTVFASPYTPAFCDWAFAYERDDDHFNPSAPHLNASSGSGLVPTFPEVNIMVTHGPPRGILDSVSRGPSATTNAGCAHLWQAVKRCKPLLHVFGHIHEGWGAEKWNWDGKGRGEDYDGRKVEEWTDRVPLEERMKWAEEKGRVLDMTSTSEFGNIVQGQNTLFVNASIRDVHYQPINAPWIIDFDLPLEKSAQ